MAGKCQISTKYDSYVIISIRIHGFWERCAELMLPTDNIDAENENDNAVDLPLTLSVGSETLGYCGRRARNLAHLKSLSRNQSDHTTNNKALFHPDEPGR